MNWKRKIKDKIPKNQWDILFEKFKNNNSFDTQYLDKEISDFVLSNIKLKENNNTKDNHIALLTTELYDAGGHTELVKNIVCAMPREYETELFLTKKTNVYKYGRNKINNIAKYAEIEDVDLLTMQFKNKKQLLQSLLSPNREQKLLEELFYKITSFSPKILITFIHMDDVFSVAILALLKKYTDIKIIFCNIGSHYDSIGMSFADLIWEGMPTTAFVTQKYRGFKNTHVMGLVGQKEEELPLFSLEQIKDARNKIGIPQEALCSMTGCSSYKLFDGTISPYFEMTKKLLEKNVLLYHIVITILNEEQTSILSSIFGDSTSKKRLIIIPFSPDYKLLFKCADVFIDSFPVSSALTMVDLMSLKVPFAAKINTGNIVYSFHEYFPEKYPYMFKTIDEMEAGVEKLLSDKSERDRVIELNYKHFMDKFEGEASVQQIIDLIKTDDWTPFYDGEISGEDYNDSVPQFLKF